MRMLYGWCLCCVHDMDPHKKVRFFLKCQITGIYLGLYKTNNECFTFVQWKEYFHSLKDGKFHWTQLMPSTHCSFVATASYIQNFAHFDFVTALMTLGDSE